MPYGEASFWEETLQTVERRSWPATALRLFFISESIYRHTSCPAREAKAGSQCVKTSGGESRGV
jgi:hypothetical protein